MKKKIGPIISFIILAGVALYILKSLPEIYSFAFDFSNSLKESKFPRLIELPLLQPADRKVITNTTSEIKNQPRNEIYSTPTSSNLSPHN